MSLVAAKATRSSSSSSSSSGSSSSSSASSSTSRLSGNGTSTICTKDSSDGIDVISSENCFAWLTCRCYGPAKAKAKKAKEVKSNNADCIHRPWIETKNSYVAKTWAVMAVFNALNASNSKLPAKVVSRILRLAQDKEIFQESDDDADEEEGETLENRDRTEPKSRNVKP